MHEKPCSPCSDLLAAAASTAKGKQIEKALKVS
jgi:hypothetical protein